MSDRTALQAPPFPFDVPLAQLRARRSAKWTSYAADVLPLPVAEMDVRLAPPILAALQTALDASDTGYAGHPAQFIAAFAGFAQRRWNWSVDPGDVRLCADVAIGTKEVLRRLTASGERVVITPPVYPPFYAWLADLELLPVEVPLTGLADGGRLDLDGIEAAFVAGARVLILCNPHNPTGRVHEADELRSLVALAVRYDAVVLSDEIHAPLTFGATPFQPYLTLGEDARATGIALTSASKAWNLAGLKCALVVAGPALHARVFRRFRHETAWGVGQFGLVAGTAAFAHGDAWLDQLLVALESNVRLLQALLAAELPLVSLPTPQATYLAWLDFRRLHLEREPAPLLLERGRVALAVGRDFGPPGVGHARLNFACSPDVLREAISRIAQALAA